MAQLQKISSRIHSVKTTKKITKAMQLVAFSKLKKAKDNLESIKDYFNAVLETFQNLDFKNEHISLFEDSKKADGILYIVITSDLGLCGPYNSIIMKSLKQIITKKDFLIIAGNKGVNSLKEYQNQIIFQYVNYGDLPNYKLAKNFSEKALNLFLLGRIKEIKIVYTEYINSLITKVKINKLLPLDFEKKNILNAINKEIDLMEFEPSSRIVFEKALPLYISTMIFGAVAESKVSEISSRRVAMENASDNAQDLIDELEIEYNKARQSKITQEISEIIAGSTK